MIQATRVADPASVGVIIGAAPLVIIIAAAVAARRRPTRRVLFAAAVVTAGSAAAQLGGATGPAFSAAGLAWSAGALAGVAGTSLLAAPVLPRLGALAVTIYACALAGLLLLAAAAVARSAGGPPILAPPTPAQVAALAYLTIAVTALVFIAWYAALERLGTDRIGLFNGLIPITSLAAVALTGTGTITPFGLLGALSVLAGVILGLSRTPHAPARTASQAGPCPQPSAETTPVLAAWQQDATTVSGHSACAVPKTRSARPVSAPPVISSAANQASRASSTAAATADTAGRSPQGTAGPRRQAPTGQATSTAHPAAPQIMCGTGRLFPACSGFAATIMPATAAAISISRPGTRAGRSPRPVTK
jgi:drug/metabolite transporter (DMT)-like permease